MAEHDPEKRMGVTRLRPGERIIDVNDPEHGHLFEAEDKGLRAALRLLPTVVRETLREARRHPALFGAVVMYPLGYRWRDHRWVAYPRVRK